MPAIVVRKVAFSYTEQVAWVRWGRSCFSSTFGITNRTQQGSVASPAFWNIYLAGPPLLLATGGRHWLPCGRGVCGRSRLRRQPHIASDKQAWGQANAQCEQFCLENNIQFSTHEDASKSKSKAIYVVGSKGAGLPRPNQLQLCGRPLPWVERQTTSATLYTRTRILEYTCTQ